MLKRDLAHILAYPDTKLALFEERKYKRWIKKRSRHIPVWYITGYEHFYGLDFKVSRNVLIPRPETEILVEKALSQAKKMPPTIKIADIGTGSGAIGISLAKNLPNIQVYLVDISKKALAVAKKNAKNNKVNNVVILSGNLLEPLPQKVDLIVANLPYVPSGNIATLAYDIHHYEPRLALEGGNDGLDLYRLFFKQAPSKIKEKGKIFLEIGENQGPKMVKIAKNVFPQAQVRFEKDWAGLDRFVIVELCG